MFTKIHDGIWASMKRKDVSQAGRLMFIYLFSNVHRNIIGLYHLPLEYVSADLGEPLVKIKATVKELLDKGLIVYDYDTNYVLVRGYLEHNPLINTNAVKSAVEKVREVPDTLILQDFLTVLEQLSNSYGTVIQTVAERLANKEDRRKKIEDRRNKKEDKDEGSGSSNNSVRTENPNEDVSRVMTFYMDKINTSPSSVSCQELLGYVPILSADVVIKAMSIALDEHKPQWSYIRGILRSWAAQDVKSLSDVQRLQDERDAGKARQEKFKNGGGNNAGTDKDKWGDLEITKLGGE